MTTGFVRSLDALVRDPEHAATRAFERERQTYHESGHVCATLGGVERTACVDLGETRRAVWGRADVRRAEPAR